MGWTCTSILTGMVVRIHNALSLSLVLFLPFLFCFALNRLSLMYILVAIVGYLHALVSHPASRTQWTEPAAEQSFNIAVNLTASISLLDIKAGRSLAD